MQMATMRRVGQMASCILSKITDSLTKRDLFVEVMISYWRKSAGLQQT